MKKILDVPYHHPAWIEVDLDKFRNNISIIKKKVKDRLLCLPIKANAYGHGLVRMAQAAQAFGVDYLAVSCLQEGVQIRQAKVTLPILVMGAIHEDQIPSLLSNDLEITVASAYKAELIAKVCETLGLRCRVHIEIDTGMQRTGMRVDTALRLIETLSKDDHFEIVGAYSHLATSEKPESPAAFHQIAQFDEFKHQAKKLIRKPVIFHLANSGGVTHYPQSYFDMVRPGLLAFGYYEGLALLDGLEPFLSIKANIAYFKVVEKEQGISYGHSYKTTQPTRIITIPIGYGDGYRRCLSGKAQVLIRGKRHPIVGAICMDQLMVDIGQDEAYVGEEVVLLGNQGVSHVSLHEIASACDTIPYEILCGFNQRLPRVYLGK